MIREELQAFKKKLHERIERLEKVRKQLNEA